jgi:hypothetical protein
MDAGDPMTPQTLTVEGTPEGLEDILARARRSGCQTVAVPLGDGRLRLTVAQPGAPLPRDHAPSPSSRSRMSLPAGAPMWVPVSIVSAAVTTVVALVAVVVVWARSHHDQAMALGFLAVVIGIGAISARSKRSKGA